MIKTFTNIDQMTASQTMLNEDLFGIIVNEYEYSDLESRRISRCAFDAMYNVRPTIDFRIGETTYNSDVLTKNSPLNMCCSQIVLNGIDIITDPLPTTLTFTYVFFKTFCNGYEWRDVPILYNWKDWENMIAG